MTVTKAMTGQQYLKVSKHNPDRAHQLVADGLALTFDDGLNVGSVLDVVHNDGSVDTEAAGAGEMIEIAIALLGSLMGGGGDGGGVNVEIKNNTLVIISHAGDG